MSLQRLCFATNNSKKLEEIRAILGAEFQILSLEDIGCLDEIPEDHDTLEANSKQKAQYIYTKYGMDCFADDTGLEIDALDGEPGVYSARYAGAQRDNDANMNLVLEKLSGQENRQAQFRTVVTLICKGKTDAFEGIVRGTITETKSGEHGFGYDPIFIPENESLTFAQMTPEAKNKQSHRGRAVAELVNFFEAMSATKPYVLGICGGSGSGKGYFVETLLKTFEEDQVAFLSLDHYYVDIDLQQKDGNGIENFDLPAAIDSSKFASDLKRLIAGDSIKIQEYTFNNPEEKVNIIEIVSRPIIIVEGIFIFHYKEVSEQLDLKLFVEAPDHLKIKRRILRDSVERGYDLADVLYRYEHHVSPAYDQFIAPYKLEADMIINNSDTIDNSVAVISNHIKQYL